MNKKSKRKRAISIIDAALACFCETSSDRTSIEEIRQRSGASIGSIYHHFQGKEDLVAAVYTEGLARYNASFAKRLAASQGTRQGVQAMVSHHLDWVAGQPSWARFLLEARRADVIRSRQAEIARLNRSFVHEISSWIRRQVASGGLAERIPVDLFLCLILGPCQEYARYWMDGHTATGMGSAKEQLGRAAWDALLCYRPASGRVSG